MTPLNRMVLLYEFISKEAHNLIGKGLPWIFVTLCNQSSKPVLGKSINFVTTTSVSLITCPDNLWSASAVKVTIFKYTLHLQKNRMPCSPD